MKIMILLAVLALSAGTLHAALQEARFASGTCDNGRVWWTVTTYVNGQAYDITGVNCEGARYSRDLHCATVSADPTGGVHTESGTGPGGGTWYARVRYDAQQWIAWIGGKNLDGSYYATTISYDPPGPGDLR